MSEQINENNQNARLIIIIDHNLGGGAKLYSSSLVLALVENNYLALHIKYNHRNKEYILLFRGAFYEREYSIKSSYDGLKEFISSLSPSHILVNELVTWEDPLAITKMILDLNVPFTPFVHDFFYICPSYNLTNEEGVFCNVPDEIEICIKCLALNKVSPHIPFYTDIEFNINKWREYMSTFLHRASQIVCFSESSKDFLSNVYSDDLNILVNEHSIPDVNEFKWKQRTFKPDGPLTVGIIGSIGLIKGERILNDLVNSPEFQKLPVNIVVIGVTSTYPKGLFKSEGGQFTVTSKFNREDLPDLLGNNEINAILIPSIWPETFSYITSEAMLLGYPVICFNMGAPAERVIKYDTGMVVDDISSHGMLKAIKYILDHPHVIEEWSRNCHTYIPPSTEDHMSKVFALLNCTSQSSVTL